MERRFLIELSFLFENEALIVHAQPLYCGPQVLYVNCQPLYCGPQALYVNAIRSLAHASSSLELDL